MADMASTATKGLKSAFSTVSGAMKPLSLSIVFTTAFAAFDGGLSAATLTAVNSSGAAGLLAVPAEGIGEIAGTMSDGLSWISGAAAPI